MTERSSSGANLLLTPVRLAFSTYLYGRALFPASPFSWLAPVWFYTCGALATGQWSLSGTSMLRFMLGLLLVGPLLGSAWRGAHAIVLLRQAGPQKSNLAPSPKLPELPYSLPDSAAHRLTKRLNATWASWRQVETQFAVPLIELATGSAGALIVAAQLGPWTILLTSAQLAAAVATCAGRSGWANASLAVALPLTVAWLFGSTLSGALAPASVLVSVSFGLSTSSALSVARSGHGLLWQAAPQVVALCCLLWIGQPLAAAGMGLLCVAQVLWAPLLPEPGSRAAYFRSLQLPWAAAMLLAAWALGTAQ